MQSRGVKFCGCKQVCYSLAWPDPWIRARALRDQGSGHARLGVFLAEIRLKDFVCIKFFMDNKFRGVLLSCTERERCRIRGSVRFTALNTRANLKCRIRMSHSSLLFSFICFHQFLVFTNTAAVVSRGQTLFLGKARAIPKKGSGPARPLQLGTTACTGRRNEVRC